MIVGSNPVAVTKISDIVVAWNNEFLDIQETIECRLAKWLSAPLQTKWLWVRIPLLSLIVQGIP